MVNVLVGNKNVKEFDIFCPKLTNDKDYKIENFTTGVSTLIAYSKLKPDILVLDNSLSDISIEQIIDRLSINQLERNKCNTILTLPSDSCVKLSNVAKVRTILYKPMHNNELSNTIEQMANEYYTPDLELYDVDELLQSLEFNCISIGYKYMRDAIIYCYYNLDKLEFLNSVFTILSDLYNVPELKIRDTLNSCIRTFNNSTTLNTSNELYRFLCNDGNKITLKSFLEKIVFYLIKAKRKG